MMKKQHKKLANELRGLTFAPDLHLTQDQNSKFVSSYEPLYKRYNFEIERKNLSKLKLEDEKKAEELKECTFQPKISQYSARKARREQNRQSVEDRCLQFGMEKELWARERRNIIKRLELKGATFRPKVSKKSNEMFQNMKIHRIKPEDRKRRFRVKHDNTDAGHEEETFRPKINPRSRVKRSSSNVYKRLYSRARQRDMARREFASKYMDRHVRGVAKPLWARDDRIPKTLEDAALSGVERSELRESGKIPARFRKSTAHFCSLEYTNVVEWKESYSFMIPRLMSS